MIYERGFERAGGAERQTHLLARALARHGYEVAHITFPVRDLVDPGDAGLTVIQRPPRRTNVLAESLAVWRALRKADAEVQIVRTATPALGIVGLFCIASRRKLIFSSANDGDFTYETIAAGSRHLF